jgi:photosystem II stability/assembly factor-like uncharacterized protein
MKKTSSILAILVCFATFNCRAQWVQLNSGTIETLNTVYFTDNNTGYAGGSGATFATLLKTTNGGQAWSPININTVNAINSICFPNSQIGYLVTTKGEVFKTTNAGANWVLNKNTGTQYKSVLTFLNKDTGFVAYGYQTIFRTLNGGVSWDSTFLSGFYNSTSFSFPSVQIGYLVSFGGQVAKTTDMGNSWAIIGQPTSKSLEGVSFSSIDTGYTVGGDGTSNIILKTVNGGANWSTQITNPISTTAIQAVHFIKHNFGYIGGISPHKTVNGGVQWNSMTPNLFQARSFSFPSDTIGYAVGYNGKIFKLNGLASKLDHSSNLNRFSVSPNPITSSALIKFDEYQKDAQVIIKDVFGREVFRHTLDGKELIIEKGEFNSGYYIIQIVKDNIIINKKIIVD